MPDHAPTTKPSPTSAKRRVRNLVEAFDGDERGSL